MCRARGKRRCHFRQVASQPDEAHRQAFVQCACRRRRGLGAHVRRARRCRKPVIERRPPSDGPEALEAAAKLESIDLLITDLMMPQMSGDELARRPAPESAVAEGAAPHRLQRSPVQGEARRLWQDEAFLDKPCSVKGLHGGHGAAAVRRRHQAEADLAARPRRATCPPDRPRRHPPRVCISRCGSFFKQILDRHEGAAIAEREARLRRRGRRARASRRR